MQSIKGEWDEELSVAATRDVPAHSIDDVLRFFGRRWMSIAIVAIIGFGLTTALVASLEPRYAAETLVALNTDDLQVLEAQDIFAEAQVDNAIVRTEMDKLSAEELLEAVAEELDLFSDPEFAAPPRGGGGMLSGVRALLQPHDPPPQPDAVQRQAEKSAVLRRAAVVKAVASRLRVSANFNSYVIRIRFVSGDPIKSATIANKVVEIYLRERETDRQTLARGANAWLDERLGALRGELRAAESAVQAHRARFGLVSSEGGTVEEQQMVEISTALSVARAERLQAEARLNGVQTAAFQTGGAGALNSDLMNTLREQEILLQRQIAELANRYGPRHTRIITLQAEMAQIRARMSQEVGSILQMLETEVSVARAREESLETALGRLERDMSSTRSAEARMRELEREAEATRQIFESFLERYKQVAEHSADIEAPEAQQIARAELSTRQIWPRSKIMIAGGSGFFLLLGVILALVLEALDSGFQTVKSVARTTGLAVVAKMPRRARGRLDQFILREPFSAVAEGLRAILTSIGAVGGREAKVIGFVSSVPGEGKTTTARALARLNAISGRKVLLIDCDFRRGAARNEGRPGMSELLSNRDASLDKLIMPDPESGLHFLPPGRLHINPPTLLGSPRMKRLLAFVRERYDLVLIDLPAVLPVADALALSRDVDTFIYLVQWKKTSRSAVSDGMRRLNHVGANIAGVVLTKVDIKRFSSYGYGGGRAHYTGYAQYANVQAAE